MGVMAVQYRTLPLWWNVFYRELRSLWTFHRLSLFFRLSGGLPAPGPASLFALSGRWKEKNSGWPSLAYT